MFLLDTNIISTFVKIDRFELLFQLFGQGNIAITENVVTELDRAVEIGFIDYQNFFDEVDEEMIKIEHITKDDISLMRKLPNFMGAGEKDSYAICKNNNYVLVTDDRKVYKYCRRKNVDAITLHMILRAFWKNEICTKNEVETIIEEITIKDKKVINRESILVDG